MNAFEGRAADLQREVEELFNQQTKSADSTFIPATFLRVTVEISKPRRT